LLRLRLIRLAVHSSWIRVSLNLRDTSIYPNLGFQHIYELLLHRSSTWDVILTFSFIDGVDLTLSCYSKPFPMLSSSPFSSNGSIYHQAAVFTQFLIESNRSSRSRPSGVTWLLRLGGADELACRWWFCRALHFGAHTSSCPSNTHVLRPSRIPIGSTSRRINIWSVQKVNSHAITWSFAKQLYGPSGPYLAIVMGVFGGFGVMFVGKNPCI
jgi:hypothetical protein